jgi:hypothetical protein
MQVGVNPPIALSDPAGTLPKACNASLVDIESVMENLTESEVWRNMVLRLRKVPLQAFFSVPAGSVGRVVLQR